MTDYSLFYRRPIRIDRISYEVPEFDIFISAYNNSDRVNDVFREIRADKKIWLIHPEYGYAPIEQPEGELKVCPTQIDEIIQVNLLLADLGDLNGKKIGIDITGFMRHVLVFLIAKFAHIGVRNFITLYSEPVSYLKQEDTTFSTSTSGFPRPVRGMASSINSQSQDCLILGVGYDHKLISEVVDHKESSTVFPIFSFPSLSPDMYQQSAVRSSDGGAAALASTWTSNRRFAPANDPFSTAGIISELVYDIDRQGLNANIYISPLSTKVQALGFALYWQLEGRFRGAVTMLLPECKTYSRETTRGLKRLWMYTIEL
ncbi:hypothetical protein [Pseudomonas oryzihabitans]|uniref:hypothetical protein n=1 Tax=Pseudomonas oryzihabitans TaxID=47885 RepID=UPI00214E8609|nr:hypothetical protein [Pseudomonas psychrotolerans]UUW70491.1 hypothetical protein NRG74_15475 [Pseudomonas psychrotolerans]